ncbi:Gfo/Idh/MocA family oxidoreductase [Brachybacterium halotolerans subsp. kimchii]|uniref:Gfo/Idh/MocA family protein n=1 Tax=Brachybacterium halotolerans TaxID=2795215 RepID=UPI001E6549CE|nr:Gfo/Idh/MocA family oxidoreductase [Brachybacterium halotolerans]UEJ81484.1 Gfo/Idh/MocA family oxidoreductase [Brachybacterium halotolerans subsp. kimchii]
MTAPSVGRLRAGSTNPLRAGIIGTGGISRAHAPGWIDAGAELHAFSLEGADAFAQEFGAIVHEDLEDLLAAVDVVDVCTPTPSHPEIVHSALDAGRDVVCEKPLALRAEDARSLVEHAERAGRLLFPAHVVRFFPQYAAAERAIERGAIGTPAVLRFERTGAMPKQPWFADETRSGGIVMDQMIHDIDQAIWMAGPVTSVFAQQNRRGEGGSLRTAHVVLTHAGGVISHCRGLWGAPGTRFHFTFSLAGDAGRLEYDSASGDGVAWDEVASSRGGSDGGYLPDVSGIASPYALEISDAVAALETGSTPRVTGADGVTAVEIALAALESIATGRRIAC